MVSKASSSASAGKSEVPADPQTIGGRDVSRSSKDVTTLIDSLKKQVINDRYNFIKKRMEENKQKLCGITNQVYHLSKSRRDTTNGTDMNPDLLTRRKENVLCTLNGFDQGNGDRDNGGGHEDSSCTSSAVLSGNNYGGKNAFRPIKLLEVPKLPPYTTWIFLDRNQRMTEDQSVVGRRRIYYDQNCGEALICSDSEEEAVEDEEEKKEFGNSEEYVVRLVQL